MSDAEKRAISWMVRDTLCVGLGIVLADLWFHGYRWLAFLVIALLYILFFVTFWALHHVVK